MPASMPVSSPAEHYRALTSSRSRGSTLNDLSYRRWSTFAVSTPGGKSESCRKVAIGGTACRLYVVAWQFYQDELGSLMPLVKVDLVWPFAQHVRVPVADEGPVGQVDTCQTGSVSPKH